MNNIYEGAQQPPEQTEQEKYGYQKENLYDGRVSSWTYKDGIFTGSLDVRHYPQGCGWSFRTNIPPGENGEIPYLKELVAQIEQEPISPGEDMQFIVVRDLEGMKTALKGYTPFIEAHIDTR